MESEDDDEDEEDGQQEEGEISTFLKSKNSCFLDHCLSDLPEGGVVVLDIVCEKMGKIVGDSIGNWRDRLISPRHKFLHLFVLRFEELRKIFLPPATIPLAKHVHLIALRISRNCMSARAFYEPDLVSKFVEGYCNIRDLKSPLSDQRSTQEMEAGTSSRHSGIGRRRGRTLTRRARDERLSLGQRRSTRRRSENSESKCDQSLIKRNIWAWLIEAKVIEENIKICCLTGTRGHASKRIFLSTFYVN